MNELFAVLTTEASVRPILLKGLSALIAFAFLLAPSNVSADIGPLPTGIQCENGNVFAYTSPYPGTTQVKYDACVGAYSGNNEPPSYAISIINDATYGFGLDWTVEDNYAGKNEDGGVQEIFDPATSNFGTTGELWLKNRYSGAFILALKASNAFSLYYWENLPAIYGFKYDLTGVNPDGQNALSHASGYYDGSVVPEPATIILLGSGLLGVGLVGYRRRKNS